jgi:hypothetical protein
MPDDFNNRLKASKKLESATTALIKTAHKLRTKAEKAAEKSGQPLEDKWTATPSGNETEGSIAERLVPEKKRPTHKLPSPKWMPFALPFLGTKVDTINWCKDQIVEHDKNLESKREQLRRDIKTPGTGDNETYPPLNSAFVLFNQQIGAHLACQSLIHNEPYAMSGRYIETAPADVICTCPPELLQLGDCPLMSLLVDDSTGANLGMNPSVALRCPPAQIVFVGPRLTLDPCRRTQVREVGPPLRLDRHHGRHHPLLGHPGRLRRYRLQRAGPLVSSATGCFASSHGTDIHLACVLSASSTVGSRGSAASRSRSPESSRVSCRRRCLPSCSCCCRSFCGVRLPCHDALVRSDSS